MNADFLLISIRQANVQFKGAEIFHSLDFNWEKGQQWAIIGDSGRELTAFLELIRGHVMLSNGEILRPFAAEYMEMKNRSGEIHSYRDLISFVSQRYEFRNRSHVQNFYFQQRFNASESEDTLTVREYLLKEIPKNPEVWTLQSVLDLLKLNALQDKSVLKLSNGEIRKLALALGLMRQPKIFLMDQPLTGLDTQSRNDFGDFIKILISKGIQVLLTCLADEIPIGVTHVGQISTSGFLNTWKIEEYKQHKKSDLDLGWNWELLKILLPQTLPKRNFLIRLNDVSVKYASKEILKNISWEVKSGERWSIEGDNGSGKSTLLSLVIGENPQAYSQDIWLFDRKRGSGESIWDIKRPTGFVAPELGRFFPSNQTCRKVILSGLFDSMGLFKKISADENALGAHWLRFFGLDMLSETPFNRLSLEHQRWTLLARALIKNPELLILDEASQGMDENQKRLFRLTIEKILEFSSIALIYVSHYLTDVPKQVNNILVLEK